MGEHKNPKYKLHSYFVSFIKPCNEKCKKKKPKNTLLYMVLKASSQTALEKRK